MYQCVAAECDKKGSHLTGVMQTGPTLSNNYQRRSGEIETLVFQVNLMSPKITVGLGTESSARFESIWRTGKQK